MRLPISSGDMDNTVGHTKVFCDNIHNDSVLT